MMTSAQFISVVTLAVLLTLVVLETASECSFPEFLVKKDPWVGDYVHGHNFLVAYIKASYMDMNEPLDNGQSMKYKRDCVRRVTDDKYIVRHVEEGQTPRYACMQFIERAENIVQLKTSNLTMSSGDELCDNRRMALDAFPLINSEHENKKGISCPFKGGYNIEANFHNKSIVCKNTAVLMRLESECDDGEGISIDFREERCVPSGLPRTTLQRAYCVAHWTQENYYFIILRHATKAHQYFCMRISDPLSDIRSAYLWFQATCDTTPEPDPHISTNYMRMNFTRRLYNSACEDEIELCDQLSHLCEEPSMMETCARTCKLCQSENELGLCPFGEQFRGSWMESSIHGDVRYDIGAYTLSRGQGSTYDCLKLEEKELKEKRVLIDLSNNGCLPRYACVEMTKVTSSVMRFRMGNRVIWPLPSRQNMKAQICKKENFATPSRSRHSTRLRRRPDRLLVNTESIQEVACNIPVNLHNGIAFNEEDTDDRVCEGCLNYNPSWVDNGFVIQPTNCSVDPGGNRRRNQPIQYSCLASFNFHNRSHSVVTKTLGIKSGDEQYLVWVFTPKGKIQVMKAAETFVLEHKSAPDHFLEVEFSIQAERSQECRNSMFLPRTTSTPRPTHNPYGEDFWEPNYPNNGNHDGGPPEVNVNENGEIVDRGGYETVDHDRDGKGKNGDGSQRDNPRFDTSRGEEIDGAGGGKGGKDGASAVHSTVGVVALLSVALGVTLMTSDVMDALFVVHRRTSVLSYTKLFNNT